VLSGPVWRLVCHAEPEHSDERTVTMAVSTAAARRRGIKLSLKARKARVRAVQSRADARGSGGLSPYRSRATVGRRNVTGGHCSGTQRAQHSNGNRSGQLARRPGQPGAGEAWRLRSAFGGVHRPRLGERYWLQRGGPRAQPCAQLASSRWMRHRPPRLVAGGPFEPLCQFLIGLSDSAHPFPSICVLERIGFESYTLGPEQRVKPEEPTAVVPARWGL
jgi:hypothetical protein